MKKLNGFIFIETIVVICVITTALVLLFSSYSYILRKSRQKDRYDTSEFIYKTYYVNLVLEYYRDNLGGDGISIEYYYSNNLNECTKDEFDGFYSITCDLSDESYNGYLYQLKEVYEVDKIYYLSPKEILTSDNSKSWLNLFDATTIDYINNLGEGVDYKVLIVKYKKTYGSSDGSYEVYHSYMEVSA